MNITKKTWLCKLAKTNFRLLYLLYVPYQHNKLNTSAKTTADDKIIKHRKGNKNNKK